MYDLENQEFFVSRDVHFHENVMPYREKQSKGERNEDLGAHRNVVGSNEVDGDESDNGDEVRARESMVEHNGDGVIEEDGRRENSGQGHSTQQRESSAIHTEPVELERETREEVDNHLGLRRGSREKRTPTHLQDYVCHSATVRQVDPNSTHSIQRGSTKKGTKYPIEIYVTYDSFSPAYRCFLAALTMNKEPRNYVEAVKDVRWREAMTKEINALEENKTWIVVDLPPGKRPIGCKWVYKIKYNADGTIERFKARLVAQGFTQVEGIDFHETFAPVAKLVSVRCLLSVAMAKGWELHQLDVNNAFLHGDLDEEVYMKLPPGFVTRGENKVCKLKKSLYGLRQASRNWFAKLAGALRKYGFVQSQADYSLFTYNHGGVFMAVLVYVDDLILAGNNNEACVAFKSFLDKSFGIKNLGDLKYFLGIEVARGEGGLFLSQRKYALDIITECGLLGSKPVDVPIQQNHGLSLADGELLREPEKYRRLVGRLIYLTITRPELSYAVHILSQFMQSPRREHYDAGLRVVRYLKGSPGKGIVIRKRESLQLYGYCDSDWASCPVTRQSVTGYFVMLGKSPLSWKSKKQATVSKSSAEAEYRAMGAATSELLWLKAFMKSLGVHHTQPMRLYCDNQAALHIAKNPVFHERTKHIEIDCHFVRQHLVRGDIVTAYVASRNQLADLFTKALGRRQFEELASKLGIMGAPT